MIKVNGKEFEIKNYVDMETKTAAFEELIPYVLVEEIDNKILRKALDYGIYKELMAVRLYTGATDVELTLEQFEAIMEENDGYNILKANYDTERFSDMLDNVVENTVLWYNLANGQLAEFLKEIKSAENEIVNALNEQALDKEALKRLNVSKKNAVNMN